MPSGEIFEVRALICDGSNRFDPFTAHLEKAEPIMGSAARLKLAVQVVNGTEQLFRLINRVGRRSAAQSNRFAIRRIGHSERAR